MKYATEMGSVTKIYIPCFIRIDTGIQKLTGAETNADTDGKGSHNST